MALPGRKRLVRFGAEELTFAVRSEGEGLTRAAFNQLNCPRWLMFQGGCGGPRTFLLPGLSRADYTRGFMVSLRVYLHGCKSMSRISSLLSAPRQRCMNLP